MTHGLVCVQEWPVDTAENKKKDKHGAATGWLQPLDRGGRLISNNNCKKVQHLHERKIRTLKTGRLLEGGRLIQGR